LIKKKKKKIKKVIIKQNKIKKKVRKLNRLKNINYIQKVIRHNNHSIWLPNCIFNSDLTKSVCTNSWFDYKYFQSNSIKQNIILPDIELSNIP
jgi:hypothetical protein